MKAAGSKSLILLLLVVFTASYMFAQDVAEVKTRFPDEQAVIWNESSHFTITLNEGQPSIESKHLLELLYLSPQAATKMSQNAFYHNSFDQLQDYKAYTIPPEGKKIAVKEFKTTHNDSRSVFYDDLQETSFDFPAVTPGSIGHLEYSIAHTNCRLLPSHYFSHFIPVINGELKISFPKNMVVKYIIRGDQKDKLRFSADTKKGETTYTFSVSNLDKVLYYPDAPGNAYYELQVIFYIESYPDDNGNTVHYLSNLDDLYHFNWSFVKEINKEVNPELKHITDSLVSGLVSDMEKARVIYNWVHKNIKYVAFEEGMEGFVPREAGLVCDRRYGDCKDMSSILTIMLRIAGLQAYYTWIGTRDLPYDYTDVWLPITDNHMITALKFDTSYIFLDGTDSHGEFGIAPRYIQDKQALVGIGENEYKIVRMPVMKKERNQLVDTTFLELTDNGIKGNIHLTMTGYFATDMRSEISLMNDKDREKFMKGFLNRGSNKFNLNHYEIRDPDVNNNFSLSSGFDLQDYDKNFAGERYLNLNLVKLFEHEEIDYPRRKVPVEFDFKNEREYITILEIPKGYKVSYLPENKSFHNDVWGFDMKYEQKMNQVILTQHFDNNYLLLPVEKFSEWNSVLEKLFPLYKQTVGLSKL